MDNLQAFASYLGSLEDSYYLFLANTVLGKVETPFHKPVLSQKIAAFFLKPDNRANVLAAIDEAASQYITFIDLLGTATDKAIRTFFPEVSYPLLLARLENLCDRLVLLHTKDGYVLNPILAEDLRKTICNAGILFGPDSQETGDFPYVDRNFLHAVMNILISGQVPAREANVHHFLRSGKLAKLFPAFSEDASRRAYTIIRNFLVASSIITVRDGHYTTDTAKADMLESSDMVQFCLNAISNGYCAETAKACARLLGILSAHSIQQEKAGRLLMVLDPNVSEEASLAVLEDLKALGLICLQDKVIAMNKAAFREQEVRSVLLTDSNMTVSYYNQAPGNDILYLFADVLVCDKVNSYQISKSSFLRAMELGINAAQVLEYLNHPEISDTLKQWEASFSRVRLYDAITLECDSQLAPVIQSHPQLKAHIIKQLAPNIFLMRRSTCSTWQPILAYAMDMDHIAVTSEADPQGTMQESMFHQFEITKQPVVMHESTEAVSWDERKATLLETARKRSCLNETVRELIESRLIISESQLDKSFRYAPLETASGFDFNAKLSAIRNSLKLSNPVLRLELTDRTVVVQPVSLERESGGSSAYLVAKELPQETVTNIPVSSIFSLTVMRRSLLR